MLKKSLSVAKRIFVLLLCAALLCTLGCSDEKNGAVADAVTFTDALGRNVSVKKHPERVAALIGSFADVWVLSGGSICAAAEDAWEDFGLELGDAVNIGGAHSPSLEKLLSADPELVIASASTASNVALRESLESMGITVVYFDVDDLEDYLSMLYVCTEITGRKDLYEKNGETVKARSDEVKERFAKAEIPESERRVLVLRVSSTSIKAKGSASTILGEMLCDLGCVNIADSDTSLLENLSAESVIREDPYRIFVVAMGKDGDRARDNLREMIDSDPAWSTLSAVSEGRVHLMDRTLFNLKPNAKWAESYEILYEIFTETQ